MRNKLMVIDGHAILTRAFYGIRELTTSDGRPTNAIYGFLKMMERVVREESPDALCVTFDVSPDTFRKKMYPAYKATRHKQPDELHEQLAPMKAILHAMNIPVYECEGWEADDVFGTIAAVDERNGWDTVIVTGDEDALQLVTSATTVKLIKSAGGKTVTIDYTPERFRGEYGFEPHGIVELKALMGDKSDNIPGVPGIGEKTAMALIQKYSTVGWIYHRHLDELAQPDGTPHKPSVRKKLVEGRESAALSLDLAMIRKDAPIDFKPEDALRREPDKDALRALFSSLELNSFIATYC